MIANFRTESLKGMRGAWREFVVPFRKQRRFADVVIAIAGSQFKVVNNRLPVCVRGPMGTDLIRRNGTWVSAFLSPTGLKNYPPAPQTRHRYRSTQSRGCMFQVKILGPHSLPNLFSALREVRD